MSAIWGCVKLDKSVEIPSNASAKMRELYEKKCKIDRVEELSFRDGFFACGIQYVTPLAFKEELPCKNDDGLYFTADCMMEIEVYRTGNSYLMPFPKRDLIV